MKGADTAPSDNVVALNVTPLNSNVADTACPENVMGGVPVPIVPLNEKSKGTSIPTPPSISVEAIMTDAAPCACALSVS